MHSDAQHVAITLREAERRFAIAAEGVRDYAIFLLDTEGTILTWSPAAEEMKGYSKPQAVGAFFGMLYTEEDQLAGAPRANLETAAADGCFQEESWRRRSDGRLFWALVELIAIHDDEDTLVGFCKITRDLTEHKALEDRLEEEKRRAEVTLATIADAVVSLDAHGRIDFMNASAEQLSGAMRAQAAGRRFESVFPLMDATGGRAELHPALGCLPADGQAEAPVVAWMDKGQGPREIEYTRCAIQGRDGEAGSVVVLRDMTECRRSEETLKLADRRKDEFLAMLAHELRNPLAPISAAAALLAKGGLDDMRVRSISQVVGRQVRHMSDLIDDLLDAARVARGLVELERCDVDLRSVVGDALEQVRPLADGRGHQIEIDLPDSSVWVQGDRKRLVQVVANLLSNAAKYTPQEGRIVLAMSANEADKRVRLSVSDNGIGMSPEFAKRAFQLFSQADRAADRTEGGLGIGLALVKNLVELHGGTVAIHSAGPHKGCTFTITLPMVTDSNPLCVVGTDHQPCSPPTVGRLRILIVDHNVDVAQLLAAWLEDMGHTATVAHDAPCALRRARSERPQVCLLDIGLPHGESAQLAREIRASPGLAHTVLVAVGSASQADETQQALAAGFDHAVVKPVHPQRLQHLLSSDLQRIPSDVLAQV